MDGDNKRAEVTPLSPRATWGAHSGHEHVRLPSIFRLSPKGERTVQIPTLSTGYLCST